MVTLYINGLKVSVESGSTLLEAARFLGFPIPTLCHMEGLSPYGACRLCVVEIGEGTRAKLVSSCTYPAEEGLRVRTASRRVMRARKWSWNSCWLPVRNPRSSRILLPRTTSASSDSGRSMKTASCAGSVFACARNR